MKVLTYAAGAVVSLVIVGAIDWWWYAAQPNAGTSAKSPAVASPVTAASSALPPLMPASAAIVEHYPVPSNAVESAAAPVSLDDAIADLVGHKAVLSLFQADDFVRRVVATVDNLGREHASARLWPLNPVPGRFMVTSQGVRKVVDPDNGQRYTPYVLLLETLDLAKAVRVYFRFYPEFDRAYVSLGYPGRHFNDRLVEVVDMLLAAPNVAYPIQVSAPTAPSGPGAAGRAPIYEFNDPALQALAAGQRMLVRMGSVNARRVRGRLAELRARLTAAK